MERRTQSALSALSILYEYAKIGRPSWYGLEDLNCIYLELQDAVNERRSFRRTITILVEENEKQREIYIRRLKNKEQKIKELVEVMKDGQKLP